VAVPARGASNITLLERRGQPEGAEEYHRVLYAGFAALETGDQGETSFGITL